MPISQELDDLYTQYEARSQARHMVLAKTAGNIAAKFSDYLGLPIATWNKVDGTVGGSRIRLGVGGPKEFEERSWLKLTSMTDGSISFSLAYTLSTEPPGRAFHIVFEIAMSCAQDGYVVRLNNIDDMFFLGAQEVQDQGFSALYDLMVGQIKKIIDPSSIIIPQPSNDAEQNLPA